MQPPKTILISPLPNYVTKLSAASPKPPGSVLIANSSPRVSCVRAVEKMASVASPAAALLVEDRCVQGRKRRLDHLTIEEKLQRKKLKNRVAAQTSRDRKKAKMDELEAEVLLLRQKAKDVMLERDTLRRENSLLMEENEELRKRLTCNCQQTFRGGCRPAVAGPAVSNPPLPQGRGLQLALGLVVTMTASLLSLLNLLEKTVFLNLKSWPIACSKRPILTWKESQKKCFQEFENPVPSLKWWGRHQKMWKPVEE